MCASVILSFPPFSLADLSLFFLSSFALDGKLIHVKNSSPRGPRRRARDFQERRGAGELKSGRAQGKTSVCCFRVDGRGQRRRNDESASISSLRRKKPAPEPLPHRPR